MTFVEPSLAVQKALHALLTASATVTALIPASNIVDRSARPEVFPCCIIGDGTTVNESRSFPRRHYCVISDLHIWTKEGGFQGAKTAAGAVIGALGNCLLPLDDCRCVDSQVARTRFMRDPVGDFAHVVVTLEALVEVPA